MSVDPVDFSQTYKVIFRHPTGRMTMTAVPITVGYLATELKKKQHNFLCISFKLIWGDPVEKIIYIKIFFYSVIVLPHFISYLLRCFYDLKLAIMTLPSFFPPSRYNIYLIKGKMMQRTERRLIILFNNFSHVQDRTWTSKGRSHAETKLAAGSFLFWEKSRKIRQIQSPKIMMH